MLHVQGTNSLHSNQEVTVNIGCGSTHMNGWINVDINPKCNPDVLMDVTKDSLCEKFKHAHLVYSEHFIEHIEKEDAIKLFRDVYKILVDGGAVRIATIDIEWILEKYLGDWESQRWLENNKQIKTKGQMLNSIFYGWGHRYIYNEQDLTEVMSSAGFNVYRKPLQESDYHKFRNIESREDSTLILEGVKS